MIRSRTIKAGILGFGRFLATCTTVITLAVLARLLSKTEYGTYRQALLTYQFVAPILMLGLHQALLYFLAREKERARSVLVENTLLLSLLGAVFSLFLLLGGNRLLAARFHNPDLARPLLALAPYPLLMLPVAAISECLTARDRVQLALLYHVVSRLLMLVAVVGLCLIWPTPTTAILAMVGAAAIVLFPGLKLMMGSTRGAGSARPSTGGMLRQVRYAVPLGLSTMLGSITRLIDKVIVSSMCTVEQFAVYSNGAFENPAVAMVTTSAATVMLPDMAQLCGEGRDRDALDLWKRAAVKCALLLYPLMVFSLLMAPEVMTVLFSPKYAESALPFRLYALLMPIRVAFFGPVLMAKGRGRLILMATAVTLVLTVSLGIVFVRRFGYIGAILASLSVTYVWAVTFYVVAISRLYGVRPWQVLPYGRLGKVMLASALAGAVIVPRFYVEVPTPLLRLVIFTPLYGLAVVLIFVWTGLLDWRAVVKVVRGLPWPWRRQ